MRAIDLNTIEYLRSLSSDPAFLPVLVDAFSRDTETEISQLKEAYKKRDNQTLRHVAHKYKSSSRNMGAGTLATLCLEVEKFAIEGRGTLPIVGEKIQMIEAEALRAVQELRAL
jgi:HPt (histidine-containing phosphotransfer) domain-containing protein